MAEPPQPLIEGPIAGNPYLAAPLPRASFDAHQYVQEEFFITGTARNFTLDGPLPEDGRADARPGNTAPYRTRLLVRRPANEDRFNGTVVVEWFNVSALSDGAPEFTYLHRHLLREGYAWVGVSAQKAGLYGSSEGASFVKPVKEANPERYGQLEHPGDAYAFDIFAQAGRAIRETQLLGDYRAQRLLAVGESQSAYFLVTYVNAVAPVTEVFDGFLIHARNAGGAALSGERPLASTRAGSEDGDVPDRVQRIRTDGAAPVLTVQSETDVITLGSHHARQPDSERFRLWEIAGAAHADTYLFKGSTLDVPGVAIDKLAAAFAPTRRVLGMETEKPINAGPQQHYIMQAALHHLNRWVREGKAPPQAPRLWLADTAPAELASAEHGLAPGGIRTPWVEVPTAVLSGLGQPGAGFTRLFGTTEPFTPQQLKALYPGGVEDYMEEFTAATDEAITAGFLLPEDRAQILALARAMYTPESCTPRNKG